MTILKDIVDFINSLPQFKIFGDTTSILLILGSILDFLPHLAALLSIIWVCIRIYETDTVQNWLYFRRYK
jgi:hypothetical protein